MDKDRFLYWLPRALGIIFAALMALMAFDVFVEYRGWELLLAFFMHFIPTFVLAGVLWLSWKKPTYGGIGYLVLGVVFTFFFDTYESIFSLLLLSVPLFVTGGLFLWEGLEEREKKGT